jgi:hypothetical protein
MWKLKLIGLLMTIVYWAFSLILVYSVMMSIFRYAFGVQLPNSLARRKRLKDDISAQRPEIGDYLAREMAAKTAFLLASSRLRVLEDCVVGAPGLEPKTH